MFDRIGNGWRLMKESFRVLRLDKELLIFPLVSGISCLLVLASFAIPLMTSDFLNNALNNGDTFSQLLLWVLLFAYYFLNYFVIVFFNSALVACAIIRFKGGDPTVSDGFRASMNRLPQIVAWALVSATVGVILRLIESQSEKVGQFVAAIMGAAWTMVTYFVVPVLVVEKAGPVEATKRSLSIVSKTWGESLTANFSTGIIFFLASMLGFFPIYFGGMMLGTNQAMGITLIALGVIYLLIVALVSSALNSIILAGLYLFASEGEVPQLFDDGLVRGAFSPTETA